MNKFLKISLRILLFGIVLFVLFRKIDKGNLQASYTKLNVVLAFSALLLYALKYVFTAWRWKISCIAHAGNISLKSLAIAQVEIAFLEIIFPVPDSEDAFRILNMRKRNYSLSESIAIVLYDRMIGLAVLFFLFPFTILLFGSEVFSGFNISNTIIAFAFLAGFAAVIFHRSILQGLLFLTGKISRIKSSLSGLRNELDKSIPNLVVAQSLLLTFIYGILGTLVPWILVRALGQEVSFLPLLAAIPLFYFSAILPLSYQGLGLYEASLILILQLLGVDREVALATGIIHFLLHIVIILTGGFVHLFNPDKSQIEVSLGYLAHRLFRRPSL